MTKVQLDLTEVPDATRAHQSAPLVMVITTSLLAADMKSRFVNLFFHGGKMSRTRTTKRKKAEKNKDWPAVVYFWILGLALASYVIARMALDGYPHSYHWISGLAGGIAGIPIGWLWYWWRGDVF